jgi:hypothetical protein
MAELPGGTAELQLKLDLVRVLAWAPPGVLSRDRMCRVWMTELESLGRAWAEQVEGPDRDLACGLSDIIRRLQRGLDPMQVGDLVLDWLNSIRPAATLVRI